MEVPKYNPLLQTKVVVFSSCIVSLFCPNTIFWPKKKVLCSCTENCIHSYWTTRLLDHLISVIFYHLVMTHVSDCRLIASKKGSRSSKSLSFLPALHHFSQVPTLSSGPRISSYHPPSTSKHIRTTFSMGLNNNDHHP
jgi:hypothetical protein